MKDYELEMLKFVLMEDEDIEMSHALADELLCKVLTEKGETILVELFNKVQKWYS